MWILFIFFLIGLYIYISEPDDDKYVKNKQKKHIKPFVIDTEEKQKYLKSNEWYKKRIIILKRDNYKCQICGLNRNLNIHHIRYVNLYNEIPEDLVTLCEKCHSDLHKKLGYSYYEEYPLP